LNSEPLVSVIVTTFNRADLLRETLDSILSQTYNNFELIVVDDGSTDNTEKVVKNYSDSRVQYIKTDNWGGPARPRNIGIKQSKGEYIAFCDDDDLWNPIKLEMQINRLSNSGHSMVFTMQKQFGATSIFSNYYGIGPLPFRVNTSTNSLLEHNCIPLSSVFIKKSLFDGIGNFNEKKSFVAIEDNDLWIRASRVTKIEFIPDILVLHRVSESSIYESRTNIEECIKEMRETHGYGSKKKSVEVIKKNVIYLFFRNLFNLIYGNLFYRSIYGSKVTE